MVCRAAKGTRTGRRGRRTRSVWRRPLGLEEGNRVRTQHVGGSDVAGAGVPDGHAQAGAGDGVDMGLRHGLPVHRLPALASPLGEQLLEWTLQ